MTPSYVWHDTLLSDNGMAARPGQYFGAGQGELIG